MEQDKDGDDDPGQPNRPYGVTPDNYKHDRVAADMVQAGVAWLRDLEYPILGGVTVSGMAAKAGVSAKTGQGRWHAEDFHVAVIEAAFNPEDPAAHFDAEVLLALAREIIDGSEHGPIDDMIAIFEHAWPVNVDDPTMRSLFALWPYCTADTRLGRTIKQSMIDLYAAWNTRVVSIIDAYAAKHGGHIRFRDEVFSKTDAAHFITVLAEGAGFHQRLRASIYEDDEPDAPLFDFDLPSQLLAAWLGIFFERVDQDGPHPIEAHLEALRTVS